MADEIEDVSENTQEPAPKTRSRAPAVAKQVVEAEVVGSHVRTMDAAEYAEYSKANGRVNGRLLGTKTVLTPEEFVVLSRANYTPKMLMDKHGIDLAELQQVADRVPLIMQLKRRIVVTDKSIKW